MIRDEDGPVELRDSDVIELVPGQPVKKVPVAPLDSRGTRADAVAVSVTGVAAAGDAAPARPAPPRRVPSAVGLARPIKEVDRRPSSIGGPPSTDRRSR